MPRQYKKIPLLGSSYSSRSGEVNSQQTVNMWPKFTKPGSKAPIVLYPTAGRTLFATSSNSPNRGSGIIFNGKAYFVSGDSLIEIDSSGVLTSKGTLTSTSGRIEIKGGRSYLVIVDGVSGYTFDGTTFAKITDPDFPANPSHVTNLDDYFIVNKGSSDEFYISAPDNPTSWAALDFEAASAVPDNADALTSNNKDLYIFGAASVQVYYNSGNNLFPFTAYTGGTLDFGILAKHSLFESSSGIFFLATSEEGGIAVVQLNGFQAKIISDDIEWDLQNFSTVTDAEGYVYRIGSRSIYNITFPTENRTFEYIVESQSWIERKKLGITRDVANGHAFLGTKNIVGSSESGNYFLLDEGVYTNSGEAVERIRVTQPIHYEHNQIRFSSVVLEVESGVALASGNGSAPVVEMRYSDNGGRTWSSSAVASMGLSMGLIGEFNTILEWHKLGTARSRIFEFKVTDPVKVVFINAYARIRVLSG